MSFDDKIRLGYYVCVGLGLFFGALVMWACMKEKLDKSEREARSAIQDKAIMHHSCMNTAALVVAEREKSAALAKEVEALKKLCKEERRARQFLQDKLNQKNTDDLEDWI